MSVAVFPGLSFESPRADRLACHTVQCSQGFDIYRDDINDELQRYFDFYCKGIDNGWEESTPKICLSVLGFENSPAETVLERPETEYPPAGVKMRTLYLDPADRVLQENPVVKEGTVSHEGRHLTASSVSPGRKLEASARGRSHLVSFLLSSGLHLLLPRKGRNHRLSLA